MSLATVGTQRREALRALQVGEDELADAPTIRHHLALVMRMVRKKSHMPAHPTYYLQSSDAPEARAFMRIWRSIPVPQRRHLPIEAICIKASISPLRLVEIIVATAQRMGAQTSSLIASIRHPEVVSQTLDEALIPGSNADRRALEKATAFTPVPKNATTTVNVIASATTAALSAAPRPESTVRRLVDRFNVETVPTLPAPPDALPAADAPTTVPVEAEFADDDES